MRLGAPIYETYTDPAGWIAALQSHGYRAAYCPDVPSGGDIQAYVRAAGKVDIRIAEVGVWNNPLIADETERRKAIAFCQERLALADEVGAACCVNIAGSRGARWDGPDPKNLTAETFEMIVEITRAIIDAVKPTRTFYTLEPMPWMYPDSTESYLSLLKAIDRPAFAVHFDPVNLICSPQRYYGNAALISEFIAVLGPHIRSVHLKDIRLQERLTTHLDEVRPGLGELDYATLLRRLDALGPDLPIMVEHLPSAEEYELAVGYIRGVAQREGVSL